MMKNKLQPINLNIINRKWIGYKPIPDDALADWCEQLSEYRPTIIEKAIAELAKKLEKPPTSVSVILKQCEIEDKKDKEKTYGNNNSKASITKKMYTDMLHALDVVGGYSLVPRNVFACDVNYEFSIDVHKLDGIDQILRKVIFNYCFLVNNIYRFAKYSHLVGVLLTLKDDNAKYPQAFYDKQESDVLLDEYKQYLKRLVK
jgi:hypothetical protein